MLLEQTVHILDLRTRTGCNAPLAGIIDHIRVTALFRRHGADDRLHLAYRLVIDLLLRHLGHLTHARQLVQQAADTTHTLHLLKLVPEVLQIKALTFFDLLGELLGQIGRASCRKECRSRWWPGAV